MSIMPKDYTSTSVAKTHLEGAAVPEYGSDPRIDRAVYAPPRSLQAARERRGVRKQRPSRDPGAARAAVPALLARGYAVASVGYRLSGEAIFPAGVLDVKRATAHLRVRAAELNLDPSSFAAWGRSAGGHLSALLGVTTGQATEFDRLRDDSSVQAVIDWYGSSDFLQMNAQFAAGPPTGEPVPGRPLVQDHDGPESLESLWVGGPIQELPGVAALGP
jgi:alpha/beta hydrolase fold